MAEEVNAEEQEGGKKTSSIVRTAIIVGLLVLVPACLAMVTYLFVISPLLPEDEAGAPEDEVENPFPEGIVTVAFEEAQASLITDGDGAAPLLIYKISVAVDSAGTEAVLTANMDWFTAMLGRLHRNRTRAELNDPVMEETILKQAKQEANRLLRQLDPEGGGEVLHVLYTKFAIYDL